MTFYLTKSENRTLIEKKKKNLKTELKSPHNIDLKKGTIFAKKYWRLEKKTAEISKI